MGLVGQLHGRVAQIRIPPALLVGRHPARSVTLGLGLAGVLGTIGGFAPAAAAAPTPVSCGSTISASGSYVLAADCSGPAIEITASDVTLDLHGHRMTGVLVGDGLNPISGVTIEGPGKLSGNIALGVRDIITGSSVSRVKVGGNIAVGGPGNTVSDNTVGGAIQIFHTGGDTVSGNTIHGSGSVAGIALDFSGDNTITDNTVKNPGGDGMWLFESDDDTITNNTLNNNGSDGIALVASSFSNAGNRIINNTVNHNGGDGIDLANGVNPVGINTVFGNTVSGNTARHNMSYDLFDGNACGSNTWTGNIFKTANLTCIQ